jgi:plasmid stabilization system protein ParE
MLNIEFLEVAQKELDDAFEYYEYQQENLGYRFISEVQKAISLIVQHPKAWSRVSKNARRCLLKSFPYGVVYQQKENLILREPLIIGDAHNISSFHLGKALTCSTSRS